jgi:multiple sugar transport system permease protein
MEATINPRKTILVRAGAVVKALNPLWFMLPAIALMSVWTYVPTLKSVFYSFTEWNMLPTTEPVYVGLENYRLLLLHPDFRQAMLNTAYYILGMLPFSVVIPMALAVVTEKLNTRAKNIYRVIFFLPMVMPPVTVAVVWKWLFHPTNGIINHVLISLGIVEKGINFLGDAHNALFSIILIAGWKMIGFSTLMFSAALTGVDKSYYDAADIDKVPKLRQTLTITLPLISPTVVYMIMLSILFTAQWTFVYINELTLGGPAGASTNVYYLMYVYGMKNFNTGMGSAAAVVFLLIFGVIALFLMRLQQKLSFYDN